MSLQHFNIRATTTRSLVCAQAFVCVLGAGSAFAQSYTLIDADMVRTTAHNPIFSRTEVRFTDDADQSQTMPLGRVLALLSQQPGRRSPPNISIGEEPIGRLRTVDGRVLFGRAMNDSEPETLVWETLLLDLMSIPLDDVREVVGDISLPFGSGEPSNPLDDAIELRNGDELTGFVAALRPMVELETSAGVRSFEPSLVRRVVLANPPRRSEDALLALADGSVLVFEQLLSDEYGESIEVIMPQMPAGYSVDAEDLVAVVFSPDTLIGLSSLGEPVTQPGADLVWIDPPQRADADQAQAVPQEIVADPFGFADLQFAGPTVASWSLPAGAVRFASGVSLPAATAPWGACEVVVSLRTSTRVVELASVVLNAQSPRAELDAQLQAEIVELSGEVYLVIEVREGEFGPVQDRPILHTPGLLVRTRQ